MLTAQQIRSQIRRLVIGAAGQQGRPMAEKRLKLLHILEEANGDICQIYTDIYLDALHATQQKCPQAGEPCPVEILRAVDTNTKRTNLPLWQQWFRGIRDTPDAGPIFDPDAAQSRQASDPATMADANAILATMNELDARIAALYWRHEVEGEPMAELEREAGLKAEQLRYRFHKFELKTIKALGKRPDQPRPRRLAAAIAGIAMFWAWLNHQVTRRPLATAAGGVVAVGSLTLGLLLVANQAQSTKTLQHERPSQGPAKAGDPTQSLSRADMPASNTAPTPKMPPGGNSVSLNPKARAAFSDFEPPSAPNEPPKPNEALQKVCEAERQRRSPAAPLDAPLLRGQLALQLLAAMPPLPEELTWAAELAQRPEGIWLYADVPPPSPAQVASLLREFPHPSAHACPEAVAAAFYVLSVRQVFAGNDGGCYGRERERCALMPAAPLNTAEMVTVVCRFLLDSPMGADGHIDEDSNCRPPFAQIHPLLRGSAWDTASWFTSPPGVLLELIGTAQGANLEDAERTSHTLAAWFRTHEPARPVTAADVSSLFHLLGLTPMLLPGQEGHND